MSAVSRRENPAWGVYARYGVVLFVAGTSVLNAGVASAGRYVTPATGAALLCGLVLLARGIPWWVAPALTTVAVALGGWPLLPLLLVALLDLATRRRTAIAVGCALAVLVANFAAPEEISLWRPQQYGAPVFLVLAIIAGMWLGNRRRLVRALHDQVEHLRIERELREETARAAERSRIAREMHDVLAHRLSLIALHTGVLATRSETLPAPVVERLGLLRTTSTEALSDLRDVLGALHDPGAATAETAPAPVLRDVRELVEQAGEAGQRVSLDVAGTPERAPAAHRLAVYRLVQEGLTNARKHAGDAPVAVRLDHGPPATVVEITNGPGAAPATAAPSGFGLVGLRERVAALGGGLEAGPDDTGGWRLAARVPHPTHSEPAVPGPEENGSSA
ncbi:hypothetical protein GCM10022227_35830 [Streptomyces sedi]